MSSGQFVRARRAPRARPARHHPPLLLPLPSACRAAQLRATSGTGASKGRNAAYGYYADHDGSGFGSRLRFGGLQLSNCRVRGCVAARRIYWFLESPVCRSCSHIPPRRSRSRRRIRLCQSIGSRSPGSGVACKVGSASDIRVRACRSGTGPAGTPDGHLALMRGGEKSARNKQQNCHHDAAPGSVEIIWLAATLSRHSG